CQQYNDLLVTF
nr:immunoglobulin light chain junction region [Macaca mulatta]